MAERRLKDRERKRPRLSKASLLQQSRKARIRGLAAEGVLLDAHYLVHLGETVAGTKLPVTCGLVSPLCYGFAKKPLIAGSTTTVQNESPLNAMARK
jgi:hypothetical protein